MLLISGGQDALLQNIAPGILNLSQVKEFEKWLVQRGLSMK